ncbi:hypothetical protein MNBD_GAMMA14-2137 [hydrothermal vent metagenome]|uniref:HTH luxR-type domain-containing protein n=1 Tax=hydrothermal vent metagenome TaxID=652676 RepID=A0A3B0Z841_9ZZZZ
MGNRTREQLIDTIYTAATLPGARHAAVKGMRDYFRAEAAGLYAVTVPDKAVVPIDVQGLDESFINQYRAHYVHCNPWLDVPEFMAPGCIRTDMLLDHYYDHPGFYRKTAYYNEWLMPQGFCHSLSTTLKADNRCAIRFYLYRGKRAGVFGNDEVDEFRNLSRHLARAAGIMQDLAGMESENGVMGRVLEDLHVGIAFIDRNGMLLQVNHTTDKLLATRDGLVKRAGRLHALQRNDDRKFSQALQGAIAIHQGVSDQSPARLDICRAEGKRPLCVTFIPLNRNPELTGIYDAAVAVLVTDPERQVSIDPEQLYKRYDFTHAEVLLAQCLVQGLTLREAAKLRGTGYETARWRLKIMFQKTGTHRQAELIRLLLSEAPLDSRNPV